MATLESKLSASQPGAETPPAAPKRVWIFSAWLDLLVGCGAWSAPLLLLTILVSPARTAQWSFAFYFLALLFNYPHFMATIYRAYHSYDEFTKYRFFTVHVALLLAAAGVIAHLWYPLLPWIFTLYICWSPWHYTGQNYGLLMMFVRRVGLSPTEGERKALHLAFVASYLMLLFSFQTGASSDALVLSMGLPAKFTLPIRVTLAAFFLIATGWAMISLARRGSWKSLFPAAVLASTQFLWFLLPALIELGSGQEVPQTRYSSGVLAVLHSAQYLWITSYYQKKEAAAAGKPAWSFLRYQLTLVAGGIALFIPGPWVVSRLFHLDFAASFLTFTALVNIHHFILDGAIWKLRDSRVSTVLVDGAGEESIVDAAHAGGLRAAWQWFPGGTPSARVVRVSVVTLLLLSGAVDRLHFYWANVSASLSSLKRAIQLNPDDSSSQVKLARAAEAAGDRDAALDALRQAARMNPGNLSLQQAYARGLIAAGHDADAYALYKKLLERKPDNVDALINSGLLAHRLGHDVEAIDTWQRAVDVDPGQANAQLYLAQSLEQVGEIQAAARHYRAYLQIVSKHPDEHRGETHAIISSLIKVADADASAQKTAESQKGYRAAIQFAQNLGDPTLQSLALAHQADLQERLGTKEDAARSWQEALLLDIRSGDAGAAAIDWLNYGEFLHNQRQDERLVLACFLKAEELLHNASSEQLAVVVKSRQESEARLGAEAKLVRLKLEQLTAQALALQPSSFPSTASPFTISHP
jgi:tetratricopeptide (TPR) repeat protein